MKWDDCNQGNFHLSISSTLADLFHLRKVLKQIVVVNRVKSDAVHLDFVELSFKEQYVSRGDMFRYKSQLVSQYVYRNKVIPVAGLKVIVDELMVNNVNQKCGIISNDTKLVFRSRSAKMFWLIQLSEEMWNFDYDGQLYFEKAVNSFLKILFDFWTEIQSTHTLSIIFFSRTFYDTFSCIMEPDDGTLYESSNTGRMKNAKSYHVDSKGKLYQDFYKVVVDSETRDNWDGLIRELKHEFMQYPAAVGWGIRNYRTGLIGRPSSSRCGNILEALNLAINVCETHYMNRDLFRTGLAINVLSAGSGIFEVSRDLIQLTKHRVIENGIGVDFIFVGTKPLGLSALFVFRHEKSRNEDSLFEKPSEYFSFQQAHWIEVSFFGDVGVLKGNGCSDFLPLPPHKMIELSLAELSRRMGVNREEELNESELDNLNWIESQEPEPVEVVDSNIQEKPADLSRKNSIPNSERGKRRKKRQPGWLNALNSATQLSAGKKSDFSLPDHESETASFMESVLPVFFAEPMKVKYRPVTTKDSAYVRVKTLPEMEMYDNSLFFNPNAKSFLPDFAEMKRTNSPHTTLLATLPEQNTHVSPSKPIAMSMIRSPELGSSISNFVYLKNQEVRKNALSQRNSPKICKLAVLAETLPPLDLNAAESDLPPIVKAPLTSPIARALSKQNKKDDSVAALDRKKLFEKTLSARIANRKQVFYYLIMPRDALPDAPFVPIETIRIDDSIWMQEVYRRISKNTFSEISPESLFSFYSLFNPFKKASEPPKFSYNRSRWVNVFSDGTLDSTPGTINWKSLTKPAILPLTTNYFPSPQELNSASLFVQYPNTLSIVSDDNNFQNNLDSLLQELLSQRLTQDFQLAVPNAQQRSDKDLKDSSIVAAERGEKDGRKRIYHMAVDGQFHQLILDADNSNIFVKRWVSKEKIASTSVTYDYRYFLWSKHTSSFQATDILLASNHEDFKWNYLDQLILGYHDDMQDCLKYRRMRFCIITSFDNASMPLNAVGIPATVSVKAFQDSPSLKGVTRDESEKKKNQVDVFAKFIEQVTGVSMAKLGIRSMEIALTYPSLESFICDRSVEEKFYSPGFGNSVFN